MFARTERLLLRPPWAEDAAELSAALNDPGIARHLSTVPSPLTTDAAAEWIARPAEAAQPRALVFLRTEGAPRLIGGVGVGLADDGSRELGYWIARRFWGLGFATEAAQPVLATARLFDGPPLTAGHFVDNPASARVLEKLGFRATGAIDPVFSAARGTKVACRRYVHDGDDGEPAMRAA